MNEAGHSSACLAGLERQLGYRFCDRGLLVRALTHRSAGACHNERLEFLGDGALNFTIGAALYARRPAAPEGDLSRLRAVLVRTSTLAAIAETLALSSLLALGPGETAGGSRGRESIRADTLEAVLGAVYIDGGFDGVQAVVHRLYADRLADLPSADAVKDAKTKLQEWLQARSRPRPAYEVVSATGADHCRHYVVRCRLPDNEVSADGQGNGRRKAEQAAAQRVLERLHRAADS